MSDNHIWKNNYIQSSLKLELLENLGYHMGWYHFCRDAGVLKKKKRLPIWKHANLYDETHDFYQSEILITSWHNNLGSEFLESNSLQLWDLFLRV